MFSNRRLKRNEISTSNIHPTIRSIDPIAEKIILFNPHSKNISLTGCIIACASNNKFIFPDACVIQTKSILTLYTCPGIIENMHTLSEPHVLWTNADGGLRKRPVLNNERCTVNLYDPYGKCLASCSISKNGASTILKRKAANYADNAAGVVSRRNLGLHFLRMLFVFCMLIISSENPTAVVFLYWVATSLDFFASGSRNLDNVSLLLGDLGDRLITLTLLGRAAFSPDTQVAEAGSTSPVVSSPTVLRIAILIEIASSVLTLHSSEVKVNMQFIPNPLTTLDESAPVLAWVILLFGECFVLRTYTNSLGFTGSIWLNEVLAPYGFYDLCELCFVFKQISSLMQLCSNLLARLSSTEEE